MKQFALVLLVFVCCNSARAELQHAKTLKTCLELGGKWDYKKHSCSPGRTWKLLTDPELIMGLERPLSPIELAMARHVMRFIKKSSFAKKKPRAVLLIGAAASGKTSSAKNLDKWFPHLSARDFIHLDGDILRKFHQGFQTVVKNPRVGYSNTWSLVKPYIKASKEKLLKELLQNHQNLTLATVSKGKYFYNILVKAGYEVYILGVLSEFTKCVMRGINRSEWSGKNYRISQQSWQLGVDEMYSLAQDKRTKAAVIIDSNDLDRPYILKKFNF